MQDRTFGRKQAAGGVALCGIPGIGGGVPMDASWLPTLPGGGQSLLISGLVVGFLAAAIWMFKRWGGASSGPQRAHHADAPAHADAPLQASVPSAAAPPQRDLHAAAESPQPAVAHTGTRQLAGV